MYMAYEYVIETTRKHPLKKILTINRDVKTLALLPLQLSFHLITFIFSLFINCLRLDIHLCERERPVATSVKDGEFRGWLCLHLGTRRTLLRVVK
jgi:hypothetical protein